jgi:cell division inhibitor SepF
LARQSQAIAQNSHILAREVILRRIKMANIFSQVGNWLGVSGGDEALPARPVAAPTATPTERPVARVTPMRSRGRGVSDVNEIFTIQPSSYEDAVVIAEYFRSGISVIVNMSELSESDARNMVHFLLGLQHGLEGHIKRVTGKVFLLSPSHVLVNEEEEDAVGLADELIVRP